MNKYLITIKDPYEQSIDFDILETELEPGTEDFEACIDEYETNLNVVLVSELTPENIEKIRNSKIAELFPR